MSLESASSRYVFAVQLAGAGRVTRYGPGSHGPPGSQAGAKVQGIVWELGNRSEAQIASHFSSSLLANLRVSAATIPEKDDTGYQRPGVQRVLWPAARAKLSEQQQSAVTSPQSEWRLWTGGVVALP